MFPRHTNRKKTANLVITYTVMTLAVVVIVTFVVFFLLGYRFNKDKGQIERQALFQFNSVPSGASISVDGDIVSSVTPAKSSVSAGKHEIIMWREGYEKWQKTVEVKSGTMTWLNYVLLVPKKLTIEASINYQTLYDSLAAPEGRRMIIQGKAGTPEFQLVNLATDVPSSKIITIPSDIITGSNNSAVKHSFDMIKWDQAGRYMIIKHTYDQSVEWLVFDTQNESVSKNISKTFDLSIDSIDFADTAGNVFYVLVAKDIRKLDLSSETISKPLVSGVIKFEVYLNSSVITYVGYGKEGTKERVIGLFREGDEKAHTIRTATSSSDVPISVSATHYFNEDYIAVSEGEKVDILNGDYRSFSDDDTANLKTIVSFSTKYAIQDLMFSPSGEYVLVQSGTDFASYDLEYQKLTASNINCSKITQELSWLDDNHLWSSCDDNITIRDYDGENVYTINAALDGQDVTLTRNGRYLYSANKNATGYQLQRVRMILP